MFKNLITIFKLILFVLWMITEMPVLIVCHYTKVLMPWYAKFYFKAVCLILGIKVKVKSGKLAKAKKLLILSNHASYLDIFAIGSVFKTNFVSKADVKNGLCSVGLQILEILYISQETEWTQKIK